MKNKKEKAWFPVYKCERCNMECVGEITYNNYGKSQFPDLDAPSSMKHECSKERVGIAYLIGLNLQEKQ